MSINISLADHGDLKPRLCVFGVGGAGGNAINNMIEAGLSGVEFWVANTDAQALEYSFVPESNRIQLGVSSTRGLGAGSYPEVGARAAEESWVDIVSALDKSNMVFITAGMGGGTGTGAGPVVAKAARELGILTVGVVTKPFHFEGKRRMLVADHGLEEMYKYCDTLIIVPNQNLFRVATEATKFEDAFNMADDILLKAVRAVSDLITMPGLVNLDFADIKAIMGETGGKAMMGTGEAEGEERARRAAEEAIFNPLLASSSVCGASGVIINITGGRDMTLFEVESAVERIREAIIPDGMSGEIDPCSYANIIFGSAFNPDLQNKIKVSVIATGIENAPQKIAEQQRRFAPKIEEMQHSNTSSINSMPNQLSATNGQEKIEEQEGILQPNKPFIPPRPQEVKDPLYGAASPANDLYKENKSNEMRSNSETMTPYQSAIASLEDEEDTDSVSLKTSAAISSASVAIGSLNNSSGVAPHHNDSLQQINKMAVGGNPYQEVNAPIAQDTCTANNLYSDSGIQKKQQTGIMRKVTETLMRISGGKSSTDQIASSKDSNMLNTPTYMRNRNDKGDK